MPCGRDTVSGERGRVRGGVWPRALHRWRGRAARAGRADCRASPSVTAAALAAVVATASAPLLLSTVVTTAASPTRWGVVERPAAVGRRHVLHWRRRCACERGRVRGGVEPRSVLWRRAGRAARAGGADRCPRRPRSGASVAPLATAGIAGIAGTAPTPLENTTFAPAIIATASHPTRWHVVERPAAVGRRRVPRWRH